VGHACEPIELKLEDGNLLAGGRTQLRAAIEALVPHQQLLILLLG